MLRDREICYGVSLISFCMLLTELVLTRIYSVILGYHFAFLAISIALFGLGVSGILVYVRRDWFPADRLHFQLSRSATAFGAAAFLAVLVLLNLPTRPSALVTLAVVYLLSTLPFFFGGLCLALAFAHRASIISRLYYFDLAGAALGSLATVVLLDLLGGPSAILFVGLLGTVAALLFVWPSRVDAAEAEVRILGLRRIGSAGAALAAVGLLVSPVIHPLAVRVGRAQFEEQNSASPLPASFEFYWENYAGAELEAVVLFART